jgi:hypothetical protein
VWRGVDHAQTTMTTNWQVLPCGRVRVQGGRGRQAGAGHQRPELRPLQVLQVRVARGVVRVLAWTRGL